MWWTHYILIQHRLLIAHAATITFYQQHRFYHKRSTVLRNFDNFKYFITLTNAISKLPEGGAEATKDAGAFRI